MKRVQKKRNKRHGSKKKRTFMHTLWRVVWKTAVALLLLALLQVFLYKWIMPPLTPLMATRWVQQLVQPERDIRFERDYVAIEKIDQDLIDAVVASEDGNFLHHHGFDVRQLKQSYLENKRGRRVRGGSTISMQTAKNAFLPHHRSMVRKTLEAGFTQLIEWWWGKERIMEVYLNIIEFGDGIYGCEAAAQHYYGHSAATLSKREAAQLAATLPAPLKRNPGKQTPYFTKQTANIQRRTAQYGTVQLDKAKEIRKKDKAQGCHTETLWDFFRWYREQKKADKAHDDV